MTDLLDERWSFRPNKQVQRHFSNLKKELMLRSRQHTLEIVVADSVKYRALMKAGASKAVTKI